VVLKELFDNALDAAEEAGVCPEVSVAAGPDHITIADNGPGIPAQTVSEVLDFSVRVSSREAYVSPTRGAQGNALKTIVAMPYALHGEQGRVEITARGIRHAITLSVDRIRQKIDVAHEPQPQKVTTGTRVQVCWPECARQYLASAKVRFLQIASDYTFLNPHLSLSVDWFGEQAQVAATNTTWHKWLPSRPPSIHWYDPERFERQLAAYIAWDADRGRDRTVREFITLFDGFTATARQKQVLEETGLARVGLSALRAGNDLDRQRAAQLLAAMQQAARRVIKPRDLGVIGKEHLQARFEGLDCELETFQYRRQAGVDGDGLQFVLETGFAWCPAQKERRLIAGVNWSPGIDNPFRNLGRYGASLDGLLQEQYAGLSEPVVFLIHLAQPRAVYADRGKSALILGNGQCG
jgi:DNA topoisomerase VI subunit B